MQRRSATRCDMLYSTVYVMSEYRLCTSAKKLATSRRTFLYPNLGRAFAHGGILSAVNLDVSIALPAFITPSAH